MAEPAPERRMTVDEFLAWSGEPDVRYELVDGVLVAMNPPMTFHGAIVVSVGSLLDARLRRRRPCRALTEAGVRISNEDYYVADLAATCSSIRNTDHIEEPALLIEVLSKSTRTDDLGRKIPAYQELPTVVEIWAVDSERRRVWVYRREGERWVQERYVGSATFRSDVLDDALALNDLYENTDL